MQSPLGRLAGQRRKLDKLDHDSIDQGRKYPNRTGFSILTNK